MVKVTDPTLDAPCGAIVDGMIRRGSYWREATWLECQREGEPPLSEDYAHPPTLPINIRIATAYAELRKAHDVDVAYHALLERVFPPTWYPRAWGSATKGGPPACARAFGAALRRMGGRRDGLGGSSRVYIPWDTVQALRVPFSPFGRGDPRVTHLTNADVALLTEGEVTLPEEDEGPDVFGEEEAPVTLRTRHATHPQTHGEV